MQKEWSDELSSFLLFFFINISFHSLHFNELRYYDKNNSLFDFFNIDTNFIDMLNEIEKVINETSKKWYYDVEYWADLINFMIKGCHIDKK